MTRQEIMAKDLNVSIDELIGAGTMPPELIEIIRIWRELPEIAQRDVAWYVRHEQAICNQHPKEDHVINVVHPYTNHHRNLKISGEYTSVDIADEVDKDILSKIFGGLQLGVDFYMPRYTPYDILLLANDRPPESAEDAVIVAGGSLFLARRQKDNGGEIYYYLIRDARLRIRECECDEVIGYVAGTVQDSGFLKEGRF